MRLDLSDRAWIDAHRLWHGWFAWRPVLIGDCLVWLEQIERRGGFDHSKKTGRPAPWRWEYRAVVA